LRISLEKIIIEIYFDTRGQYSPIYGFEFKLNRDIYTFSKVDQRDYFTSCRDTGWALKLQEFLPVAKQWN